MWERDEAGLIEDDQRAALIWHQDQKRRTWPASPGLLLVMTSRREALHFEDLYLSRESLSTSLVEELCPTVMLVRKLLCWWWWILSLVREIWGSSHRRLPDLLLTWHQDQKKTTRPWPVTMLIDKLQSNGCVSQKTSDLVAKLYMVAGKLGAAPPPFDMTTTHLTSCH